MAHARVIDAALWKSRFRVPTTVGQIASGAPIRGIVGTDLSGVFQFFAWEVPTNNLRQLTDRPSGVVAATISSDGQNVFFLDDQKGNEVGHWVRIPFEGGLSHDITPDLPPYASSHLAINRSCSVLGFVVANRSGHHLCCVDLGPGGETGPPRMIFNTQQVVIGPVLTGDGSIAVVGSTERTGQLQFDLVAFETRTGSRINELGDDRISDVVGLLTSAPGHGDARILAATARAGSLRPLIWNVATSERTDLHFPKLDGDIEPLAWASDGERILLRQFHRDVQQLYLYDLQNDRLRRLDHPTGVFGKATLLGTGEIVVDWSDPAHQWQVIALDDRTGRQTRTVLASRDVPAGHPWVSVAYRSSDGQEIQGWLSVPDGPGPFPTILHLHGGPDHTATLSFAPDAQAWVDHGFAFLTINYRGSTTFGEPFKEQIWGNPGYWEVEDAVAARQWLIEEGIARPKQILITGWSYGGYLTLLALGRHPDLWVGGIAGVAVADLSVMYEDAGEPLRKFLTALVGGTPTEKPDQYAASSPITYAEHVNAPVLIIQGRHDTRCPPRSVATYEATMKALGKKIYVRWYDGGHLGFATDVEQSIKHHELMLRFAQNAVASI